MGYDNLDSTIGARNSVQFLEQLQQSRDVLQRMPGVDRLDAVIGQLGQRRVQISQDVGIGRRHTIEAEVSRQPSLSTSEVQPQAPARVEAAMDIRIKDLHRTPRPRDVS